MSDTITHEIEIILHVWNPATSKYESRLPLTDFSEVNLTLAYNARGACSVSLDDAHRYAADIARPDTLATILIDGVQEYSGMVENQRFPLVPGTGEITFDVTASWAILDRTLGWVNPVPAGRVSMYASDGTTVRARQSPWTTGSLATYAALNRAQAGIPSDAPLDVDYHAIYGDSIPTSVIRFWGTENAGGEGNTEDEKGYWLLSIDQQRFEDEGNFFYAESGFIYHLIDQNLRRRLGYPVNTGASEITDPRIGRDLIFDQVWTGGTLNTSTERKAPLIRFNPIGTVVEDFLLGFIDEAIGFRFELDTSDFTYGMKFSTPNDVTSRPLDPEDGSIVGGDIALAPVVPNSIVIGGQGDMQDRALESYRVGVTGHSFDYEAFHDATSQEPVWAEAIPEYQQIPKYHWANTLNTSQSREAYRNNLRSAGMKKVADETRHDAIAAEIVETPYFRYEPGTPTGPGSFNVGTKVAVKTAHVGTVEQRIRRIEITATSGDGVTVKPFIGEIDEDVDFRLSRSLENVSGRTGKFERR